MSIKIIDRPYRRRTHLPFILKYEDLIFQAKSLLIEGGVDTFSADSVALGLSETSLRGVDSHGINLLPHYVNSAKYGRKKLVNSVVNFVLKQNSAR